MLNSNNSLLKSSKGCACGSGKAYSECCQPLHNKTQPALTAEALMRSRFSGFCLGLTDYLLESWCDASRPNELDLTDQRNWLKLVIYKTHMGLEEHASGTVEFGAFYQHGEQLGEMREISQFQRNSNGQWCYLSGEVMS